MPLPFEPAPITVVTGHYGCGKTNLSLNLAYDLAREGMHPVLVDLDVVNPYFRSSDHGAQLAAAGIRLVAPNFAGTNLDTPSLPPAISMAVEQAGPGDPLILDVGGDDAGATALGQYARAISAHPYQMLYVVNRYRDLGDDVEEYLRVLLDIEDACHLQASGIVNNSNLMGETTPELITGASSFAERLSGRLGLPLVCTTVTEGFVHGKNEALHYEEVLGNVYPVKVYVRTPWER